MSIAYGNVMLVATPNTMRNHLIVFAMKAFTAIMGHLPAGSAIKTSGCGGRVAGGPSEPPAMTIV